MKYDTITFTNAASDTDAICCPGTHSSILCYLTVPSSPLAAAYPAAQSSNIRPVCVQSAVCGALWTGRTKMALQAIKYSDGKLQLLDQRLLPYETVYLAVPNPQAAWQQIKVIPQQCRAVTATGNLSAAKDMCMDQPNNLLLWYTGHGCPWCARHRCHRGSGAGSSPDCWWQGQAVQQCGGMHTGHRSNDGLLSDQVIMVYTQQLYSMHRRCVWETATLQQPSECPLVWHQEGTSFLQRRVGDASYMRAAFQCFRVQ